MPLSRKVYEGNTTRHRTGHHLDSDSEFVPLAARQRCDQSMTMRERGECRQERTGNSSGRLRI